MEITKGLFDNMVLQRHNGKICNTVIEGVCNTKGNVIITAKKDGKVLQGFSKKIIGKADGKKFKAILKGLKTGGPYDIELTIKGKDGKEGESILVKNVLVGDVWILAGQSNMQGCGDLRDKAQPHNMVRAFYMTDRWDIACEPLHELSMAVDEVHRGGKPKATEPPKRLSGTGPGVFFGQEMYQLTKGVPQGLIACAHGGTSMAQWSPALKHLGGKSLYGAMLRRFNKTCGKVRGVLWYQGCSDTSIDASKVYTEKMIEFVKAIRKDFKDSNLPVVIVQIASVYGREQDIRKAEYWNSIQEQQRRLPEKIKNLLVVPAIDLPLDDGIHISGKGHQRLGKRLADAMYYFFASPSEKWLPPIEFKDIEISKNILGHSMLKVRFKNVCGKLRASGAPSGFQLVDNDGKCYIYRIDLDGDTALCHLSLDVNNKVLYYGGGFAPYCNITDEKDRSLPVFGPILIDKYVKNPLVNKAIDILRESTTPQSTPFPSVVLVSEAQPSAGKLHNLKYPANHNKLNFKPRKFTWWFWDLHNDVLKCEPNDVFVYYKIFFKCPEDMELLLSFAYDGPFKVWVNKKEVFFDPEGVNPAIEDKAIIPFSAKKGIEYEMLMALGSNNGKAWGASVRIIRPTPKLKLPSLHI